MVVRNCRFVKRMADVIYRLLWYLDLICKSNKIIAEKILFLYFVVDVLIVINFSMLILYLNNKLIFLVGFYVAATL